MATIDIKEDNLAQGVIGLVLALVEIIQDALRLQAIKRMESGRLTDEEVDRLGKALRDLDKAIEKIKEDHGVSEAVQNVRDGLDNIVSDVLDKVANPEKWKEEKSLAVKE